MRTKFYGVDWISPGFLHTTVTFPNRSTWRLTEVLAEKAIYYDDGPAPEASAVFACSQEGGRSLPEAVIRVRMQIPRAVKDLHPDPRRRAQEAQICPSRETNAEIKAITCLTEARCPHTPKLMAIARDIQGSAMWVPGGWLTCILMEKLPGLHPSNIWHSSSDQGPAMTASQRADLNIAFRAAIVAIYKLKYEPSDCHPSNLLWDVARKTCYIVDLEDFDSYENTEFALEFDRRDYRAWGLARPVKLGNERR